MGKRLVIPLGFQIPFPLYDHLLPAGVFNTSLVLLIAAVSGFFPNM